MTASFPVADAPFLSPGERRHHLHRRLAGRNQLRLSPAVAMVDECGGGRGGGGSDALMSSLAAESRDRRLEEEFVAAERAAVRPLVPRFGASGGGDIARGWDAGWDPDRFIGWFEDLRESGPGQGDPLFPWLARACTLPQMRWFLGQEVAGEAGFEDLLALTQLKMPVQVKLEMARNYWDEMGRGRQSAMHGPMLERLSDGLSVRLPITEIIWEALALGNLMVALAWNRHYAYQAIGALGVIELTAPGRAKYVNAALLRLGVSGEARRYFAVHATLDIKHSVAWNREVLRPLVADPAIATAIAEGALMRLRAGARCFDAYRSWFGQAAPVTASRARADVLHRWR